MAALGRRRETVRELSVEHNGESPGVLAALEIKEGVGFGASAPEHGWDEPDCLEVLQELLQMLDWDVVLDTGPYHIGSLGCYLESQTTYYWALARRKRKGRQNGKRHTAFLTQITKPFLLLGAGFAGPSQLVRKKRRGRESLRKINPERNPGIPNQAPSPFWVVGGPTPKSRVSALYSRGRGISDGDAAILSPNYVLRLRMPINQFATR
ncbi:hypothetical protein EDB89DRAFT_1913451 [Lactarius sanguifluus]|nr:hypothetical protein EDB89DRAFT_1913451 [Lactarius sanguifluus]